MTDSADNETARANEKSNAGEAPTLKDAADRLGGAMSALESSLGPVLGRLSALESQIKEADVFSEDRARLAAQLDELSAREQEREAQIKAREAEFRDLSEETTRELDAAITQMRGALSPRDE